MPLVKLKHIVSFSSEDKVHKAENLLKGSSGGKWRCASPGEKQASVVIQLEKASAIKSIDIGNDGSAFVEVLVSRSTGDEVYKVLLVASTFMSLSESRSGSGLNRVRMFEFDKLSEDVASEKWDRVKVVCTQPFNKHTTYGLQFINLHSPEENIVNDRTPEHRTTFGSFKLKPTPKQPLLARPVMAKISPTSLKPNPAVDVDKLKRKHASTSKLVSEAKKPKVNPTESSADGIRSCTAVTSPTTVFASSISDSSARRKQIVKSRKKKFDELLQGVVFVLSGFQNPARGEIRDKALQMGAQYQREWGADCTHLVCAFPNTPKYQQVVGTSKFIVRETWIYDCYKTKMKLPVKDYNMRPDYHSSDEETGEVVRAESSDPYEGSTDEESLDTEDEIERIVKEEKDSNAQPPGGDRDPYDESTDEETKDVDVATTVPSLPDYFTNQEFFLHGDFDPEVRRLLHRHILACNGSISQYMSDDVHYVVTESSWQQDFDDAIEDNFNLVFVKPEWIFKCGEAKKLVPHQAYEVKRSGT